MKFATLLTLSSVYIRSRFNGLTDMVMVASLKKSFKRLNLNGHGGHLKDALKGLEMVVILKKSFKGFNLNGHGVGLLKEK